ncbi:MAG: hypothetical protein JO039_00110 [Solirubrobacterales bacterium]|nr:hypothetical protein [Solirubrobacterales bacterium]
MTTIFVLNAISALLAAAGIGGWFARKRRRAQRVLVQPLYLTTRNSSRPPLR